MTSNFSKITTKTNNIEVSLIKFFFLWAKFPYLNVNISEILDSNDLEVGSFELDIFNIKVNRLKTYENSLIKL